jgi:hypothetical protein
MQMLTPHIITDTYADSLKSSTYADYKIRKGLALLLKIYVCQSCCLQLGNMRTILSRICMSYVLLKLKTNYSLVIILIIYSSVSNCRSFW